MSTYAIMEACKALKEHGGEYCLCLGRECGVRGRQRAQAHSRYPVKQIQLNYIEVRFKLKI